MQGCFVRKVAALEEDEAEEEGDATTTAQRGSRRRTRARSRSQKGAAAEDKREDPDAADSVVAPEALLQEFEDSLAVLQAEGRMQILKTHAAAGARADFELLRERFIDFTALCDAVRSEFIRRGRAACESDTVESRSRVNGKLRQVHEDAVRIIREKGALDIGLDVATNASAHPAHEPRPTVAQHNILKTAQIVSP